MLNLLLYTLHSRKETQTEHFDSKLWPEYFINTLYISHCRVFNHIYATRLSHAFSVHVCKELAVIGLLEFENNEHIIKMSF